MKSQRLTAVLALAGTAVLLPGCTGDRDSNLPSEGPSALTTATVTCDSRPPVREATTCDTVTVSGVTYRYSYKGPESNATDGRAATLVDLGGPGVTPLTLNGFEASVSSFIRSDTSSTYILIEEPWVTRPLPVDCRTALSDYYKTIRDDTSTFDEQVLASNQMVSGCEVGQGLWGFTPATYTAVVDAIETKLDVDVDKFTGSSFASIRSTYLSDRSFTSVVLHPYAPGRSVGELMRSRADALNGNFPAVDGVAGDAALPDRSILVNQFDIESAAIYQGYTGEEVTKNTTAVANASDSLWGRYLTYDLSPGWLAYWDEVCASGDWGEEELRALAASPETRVLALMHLPCGGHEADVPEINLDCMVVSDADAVTPSSLARLEIHARDEVVTETRAHRSADGLASCWDVVG